MINFEFMEIHGEKKKKKESNHFESRLKASAFKHLGEIHSA